MAQRITSAEDLATLNRALGKIVTLEKRLAEMDRRLRSTHKALTDASTEAQVASANNIVFTWNGGPLTLSWAAGYIRARLNTFPVAAGTSPGLLAQTHYWAVYNTNQGVMAFFRDINQAILNPANVTVCQVFTGSGVQSGVAGGGGSEAQSALSGQRYKNF